ncbi:FHA domain-containing protein DDL [Linum perenne]
MGRHLSNHSPSPDRGRGSPRRRRSPPPAERSPTRHRSSRGDISPVREKRSSRSRSAKREMSRSPSPVALKKNSRRDSSPSVKEKRSVESKSPRRERSGSPSPRTKRLRQALAEKEAERRTDRDHGRNHERVKDRANHRDKEGSKISERERERSHEKGGERGARRGRDDEMVSERENDKNRGRGSDRTTYKDRDTDKGNRADRKEKSHGRDGIEEKPSRGRHEHSASPSDRRHRSRRRSHSPQTLDDNRQHDEVVTNDRGADKGNDEDDSVAKMKAAEEALEAKKQKPSFELSGKLAEETNRFRGITLLFNEPPEARKPTIRWRLYVFKGGEVLNEPLYIHRQSCYLFGRERRVADIPTDHPSCSKQHAVIQYRQIEQEGADGTISKQVRPYIMDLGSTNKTFINESAIEPQRYYELFERDTIKFGNSR